MNPLIAIASAFFAIFPAIFCTVVPAIPIFAVLELVWQRKEQEVYAAHVGQIFTADMARSQMSHKYPVLYRLKFVYSGIIILLSVSLIWLITFTAMYTLATNTTINIDMREGYIQPLNDTQDLSINTSVVSVANLGFSDTNPINTAIYLGGYPGSDVIMKQAGYWLSWEPTNQIFCVWLLYPK